MKKIENLQEDGAEDQGFYKRAIVDLQMPMSKSRIKVMEEGTMPAVVVPREKLWIFSGVEAKLAAEMIDEM